MKTLTWRSCGAFGSDRRHNKAKKMSHLPPHRQHATTMMAKPAPPHVTVTVATIGLDRRWDHGLARSTKMFTVATAMAVIVPETSIRPPRQLNCQVQFHRPPRLRPCRQPHQFLLRDRHRARRRRRRFPLRNRPLPRRPLLCLHPGRPAVLTRQQ